MYDCTVSEGLKFPPSVAFCLIFPYKTHKNKYEYIKKYLPVTRLQPSGYTAEFFRLLPTLSCGVCVSDMFVYILSKLMNISSKKFSPSGSRNILVFPYQRGWQYSDGNFPNGGVEYRWVGRNREIAILNPYLASLRAGNAATG